MVVTPEQRELLKEKFPGRPNKVFSPDAYKIWLTEQYKVKKNGLLDKYECDDKLFDTLDEVMSYAEELDNAIEAQEMAQRYEQTLLRERVKKLLIGVFLLTLVVWVVSKI